MAKQSIIGRITQLAKANINALLDQAEDPQKMLDQMVRDYTSSIGEAESAVAQTIGNLRMLEEDHREDVAAADDWGRKALAASRKADELRGVGQCDGCRQVRRPRPRRPRPPAAVRERGEGRRADDRLADRRRRPAQGRPRQDAGEAQPALVEARRAHRPVEDRRGAVAGERRHQERRHPRPHERDQPLRGQDPARGGEGARPAGAGGLQPRRAVRETWRTSASSPRSRPVSPRSRAGEPQKAIE